MAYLKIRFIFIKQISNNWQKQSTRENKGESKYLDDFQCGQSEFKPLIVSRKTYFLD